MLVMVPSSNIFRLQFLGLIKNEYFGNQWLEVQEPLRIYIRDLSHLVVLVIMISGVFGFSSVRTKFSWPCPILGCAAFLVNQNYFSPLPLESQKREQFIVYCVLAGFMFAVFLGSIQRERTLRRLWGALRESGAESVTMFFRIPS